MAAAPDTIRPQDAVLRLLDEHADVSFIRLQWVDYSGVVRACVLPVGRVLSLLAAGRPFKAPSHALACAADNTLHPAATRDDVLHWLLPDWRSLRLAVAGDTATVMCGLRREQAGVTNEPQPSLCPRRALEETTRKAAAACGGQSFLVGFEVEFVVLKAGGVDYFRPYGAHGAAGLRDPSFRLVERAVKHMVAQGAAVDEVHTEGGRGQYEIALGPLPPVQAVDQLLFVQGCLKDVFARAAGGCAATMAPRPVGADDEEDAPTTGQHMHVSIEGGGGGPASQQQQQEEADSFLAGILGRLPALCGVLMPLAVSYGRLRPYCAGDAVGWATESRLVPVRGVGARHWELRCADAAANAYLAVAAVLAAGMLAVRAGEPLTWPDLGAGDGEPVVVGPFGERLPEGIDKALDRLEGRVEELGEVMGRPVLEHYVRMKRFESARLRDMEPERLTALLNELF